MKLALATVGCASASSLGPYPGYSGSLKVTGVVDAYLAKSGNAYVTYNLKGLEDACKTTPEGVANACGVHIHEGMTCDDADAVGGHYYDSESIEADPWAPVGYVTKFGGRASGSGKAAIGQGQDIAGRAVVVHDSTGGRVACALLPSKLTVQNTKLVPYPGYAGDLKVTGEVDAYLAKSGNAYVTYNLKGLEDACKQTPEGVANACGIHIHEGMTCDDADAVGGHYYDADSIDADPWSPVGYMTKFGGFAYGSGKAAIGQGQNIAGRAVVVHDSTGGRVACGLLPAELSLRQTALVPYPGYAGDLKVTGEVDAYLGPLGNAYVTYNLKGLEDACKTTPEGVANACGIHIHEGKTCDDADAVGGHYYDADSIESDPWAPVGYKTQFGGFAFGSGKAAIGKGQDIAGRAVVVHDSTGGRVACALLPSKLAVRDTNLAPYPGYSGELSVTGTVGGYLYNNDAYVWYNIAGLEADCATAPEGVANACGIHVHEGKTCDDADSVGGHYYNADESSDDPWSPVTYQASADGTSKGKTKASIGSGQDINGRAIVVHDKTGARVACALIEGKLEESVSQCDTGCRDVCNQPFTAGGPDCCAACGCARGDCPMPAVQV